MQTHVDNIPIPENPLQAAVNPQLIAAQQVREYKAKIAEALMMNQYRQGMLGYRQGQLGINQENADTRAQQIPINQQRADQQGGWYDARGNYYTNKTQYDAQALQDKKDQFRETTYLKMLDKVGDPVKAAQMANDAINNLYPDVGKTTAPIFNAGDVSTKAIETGNKIASNEKIAGEKMGADNPDTGQPFPLPASTIARNRSSTDYNRVHASILPSYANRNNSESGYYDAGTQSRLAGIPFIGAGSNQTVSEQTTGTGGKTKNVITKKVPLNPLALPTGKAPTNSGISFKDWKAQQQQ